jgi:UDP-glucose 4-epimerase
LGHVPRFPFIHIGSGLNRRTLVYDRDVARAAALAVSHPAAAGRVFNVTDGEFHSLNEIIESICAALGRKPPRWSLPVGPTRAFVGLIEKGSHAIGLNPPVTRAIIDKYTEDIAVDSSRIRTELGFKPQYDLRSGWQETVQEMRRMGEL